MWVESFCPGNLVIAHSITKSFTFQEMLNKNPMVSARKLDMSGHQVFQQDDESKHMAAFTEKWFSRNKSIILLQTSQT